MNTDGQTTVTTLEAPQPSYPVISWGAIFAGLTVIVAGTLLLTILGAAIGVSIVDITDMEAIGAGLAVGAVLWVVLSGLVVNFVGGLLAAHLSGRMTQASGLMHGVVVWAVALVAVLVVDGVIIKGVVQTGVAAAQGTAAITSSVGGAVFSGFKALGGGVGEIATSSYTDEMRARLKREAAKAIAQTEASGAADVTQTEVRAAMRNIDGDLLEQIAGEILAGDLDGARQDMRRELNLSAAEVDDIVEGVSQRIRTAADESEAVQKASGWLKDQVDNSVKKVANISGPSVNKRELREAMAELDVETTTAAGKAILVGDVERARSIIIANTSLNEVEVNAIVDGVSASIEAQGDDLMRGFNSAVESASNYVQVLLWLYFFSVTLSLGAAAIGGYFGASGLSRSTVVETHRT